MYAKVKNSAVLMFPYTIGNLEQENPSTNFGNVVDLAQIYSATEDAQKTGASLVLIELGEIPQYNPETQSFKLADSPIYENGKWVINQVAYDMSPEQLFIKNNPHEVQA